MSTRLLLLIIAWLAVLAILGAHSMDPGGWLSSHLPFIKVSVDNRDTINVAPYIYGTTPIVSLGEIKNQDNAYVHLKLCLRADSTEGHPNVFQTASINRGMRMEISGSTATIIVPDLSVPGGLKGLTLTTALKTGEWYALEVEALNGSFVRATLGGHLVADYASAGLSMETSEILVGGGFDATRVFHGQIENISAIKGNPASLLHKNRGIQYAFYALLFVGLLILYFIFSISTKMDLIKSKNVFNTIWVLSLCIICIYLFQWRAMPLYPDEVAYSLNTSRLIYDSGIQYGLYSECPSNAKIVPLFFYPAAFVLAGIGALPYWELVRVVPYLSLMVLIGTVFLFNRKASKSTHASLLFTAGFIGVAGSGMVLSRPEAFLIFHGAICLFVYLYIDSGSLSRKMTVSLLMMLYLASLISFFVHMQGFIFAPLTLMLMYRISKLYGRSAANFIAVMASSYVFLAGCYGLLIHSFRCPESTKTSEFVSLMTLPGWLKSSGAEIMSTFSISEFFERFAYFERFKFGQKYQVDNLPPINFHELNLEWPIQSVNFVIIVITGLILVSFLILCICLTFSVIKQLYDMRYQSSPWLSKLSSFATSDKVIFFTTCLAHLGLLFYVTQLNFYRAHYINLAMVVLLVVALNKAKNQFIGKIALTIGICSFMLCSTSALVVHKYIAPMLASGYSGPSIPLATNWAKVNENVHTLKTSCGISDEDDGIVVDDKTYDAMKKHRHLFLVTYIGLASEITKTPVINLVNNINAKAALARCDNFDTFHIPYKNRVDDLCCTTFTQ